MKRKESENKEKIFIPQLLTEIIEIDSALDFTDDLCFRGIWLPAKDPETGEEKRGLFFLTNKGLLHRNELSEMGIELNTILPYREPDISKELIVRIQNKKSLKRYFSSLVRKILGVKQEGNVFWHVFYLLRDKIVWYFKLGEEKEYDLIALYVMGTWFYPLFNSFPYLRIGGTKRSGKTQMLTFLEKVVFNPVSSIDPTPSSLFRTVHEVRPTLLIDEVEQLIGDKGKRALNSILNAGYKKGKKVSRAEQRGKLIQYHVRFFEVYCPKVLAGIKPLNPILADRCIEIIMPRTREKKYGERNAMLLEDKDLPLIRDCLQIMQLEEWKKVKKLYGKMENNTELFGRAWELYKPLLLLAKLLSDDVYQRIMKYAEKKEREREEEELSDMIEPTILEYLLDEVTEDKWIQNSEILNNVRAKLSEKAEELRPQHIAIAMKNLKIIEKKRRKRSTGIEYFIKKEKLKEVAREYGLV